MTPGLRRSSVLDAAPTRRDSEPITTPIPLPADLPTDRLPMIGSRSGATAGDDVAFDADRHTRQVAVLAAFLGLILLVATLMGVGII